MSRPDPRDGGLVDLEEMMASASDAIASGKRNQDKELKAVLSVSAPRPFEPLRDWFKAIYQVLLGDDQGPRFGSFIALFGVSETRKLIADALAGKMLNS